MADANTCELSHTHAPKPAALKSFKALLPTIKYELIKLRHNHDKHAPEYFEDVAEVSDHDLAAFDENDLIAVRAGKVAYGVIIFGKVRLPAVRGAYLFVRWFAGGEDYDGDGIVEKDEVEYLFHSFYTEDRGEGVAGRRFRAIMRDEDELFFFNE